MAEDTPNSATYEIPADLMKQLDQFNRLRGNDAPPERQIEAAVMKLLAERQLSVGDRFKLRMRDVPQEEAVERTVSVLAALIDAYGSLAERISALDGENVRPVVVY